MATYYKGNCTVCGGYLRKVYEGSPQQCRSCGRIFHKNCGLPFICANCARTLREDEREEIKQMDKDRKVKYAIGIISMFGAAAIAVIIILASFRLEYDYRDEPILFAGILAMVGVCIGICFINRSGAAIRKKVRRYAKRKRENDTIGNLGRRITPLTRDPVSDEDCGYCGNALPSTFKNTCDTCNQHFCSVKCFTSHLKTCPTCNIDACRKSRFCRNCGAKI